MSPELRGDHPGLRVGVESIVRDGLNSWAGIIRSLLPARQARLEGNSSSYAPLDILSYRFRSLSGVARQLCCRQSSSIASALAPASPLPQPRMAPSAISHQWHVRCLTVPGHDTDLSLHVAFDNVRFLFGCGEGTQRAFVQKRVGMRGMSAVFICSGGSEGRGGLPGEVDQEA